MVGVCPLAWRVGFNGFHFHQVERFGKVEEYSEYCLFSIFCETPTLMTLAIASIVHLPGRKPCCLLLIHIFFVVSTVYFDRTLSKVLHRFDVNDIGL